MSSRRKPLTDATIRNAKVRDARYRLSDGHGLSIEISPAAGRHWRYRYELPAGKEHLYALGEFAVAPDGETDEQAAERRAAGRFTLAEARVERQRCRDMVKRGQHPLAAKKADKLARQHSNANTFEAVAREFIEKHGREWSAKHRARAIRFLDNDVYPDIGALPIRDVTARAVLAVLHEVEKRGSLSIVTAGRSTLGQIFKYGVATGRCDGNPAADTRGATRTRRIKHHAPLDRNTLRAFFSALAEAGLDRMTELGIRLLAYVFTRPGELGKARWADIDLERAEWRIPAAVMKMKTAHVVPLSAQAVALLRELHALTGHSEWVLPHSREPRKHMANGAFLHAANRVTDQMGGLDFTPHGFRATASTLLHETGIESKLIELQLAHQERNKSKASYDHAARLPERAAMMQGYANLIDRLIAGESARDNIIPLRIA